MNPPTILCPLSRTGDEIAGETPDEVALNLHAATVISRRFRCKPVRPCPDLREVFRGCDLSPEAVAARDKVAAIYADLKPKRQPQPAPL